MKHWTLASIVAFGLVASAAVDGCSASEKSKEDVFGTGSTGSAGSGTSGSGGSSSSGASSSSAGVGGGFDFDAGPGSGSGGLAPDAACAGVSSLATAQTAPADIVLLVDTSGSMAQEASFVQQNLNQFASIITASGVDARVILIADAATCIPAPLGSGQCNGADSNAATGYQHVVQPVASHDALQLVISTYPQWKPSLRAGATKTIAVVSDDNSAIDANTFKSQLLALDPPTFEGFKFDAIVSLDDGAACFGCILKCDNTCMAKCCDKSTPICAPLAAAIGAVYQQLVADTKGIIGDLCNQDFGPIFKDMATGVVSGAKLACEYDIPAVPDGGTIDSTKVNVTYTPGGMGAPVPLYNVPGGAAACGPKGGWYYDNPANPTKILTCPATCDALQKDAAGKVEVLFGCATEVGPPE